MDRKSACRQQNRPAEEQTDADADKCTAEQPDMLQNCQIARWIAGTCRQKDAQMAADALPDGQTSRHADGQTEQQADRPAESD